MIIVNKILIIINDDIVVIIGHGSAFNFFALAVLIICIRDSFMHGRMNIAVFFI